MPIFLYTSGVLALTVGMVLFSYLDRAYRELGRVHTGRVYTHLETFEAEVEPRFHMERRRAALVARPLSSPERPRRQGGTVAAWTSARYFSA